MFNQVRLVGPKNSRKMKIGDEYCTCKCDEIDGICDLCKMDTWPCDNCGLQGIDENTKICPNCGTNKDEEFNYDEDHEGD